MNPASDGCARQNMTDGLDLIFTDIMGVLIIAIQSGPDYSRHKFVFFYWYIFDRNFNFWLNHTAVEKEYDIISNYTVNTVN